MYSLVEIAHIKAAKAAFEAQLEELKTKHQDELKLAYKAGREDIIKELGLALNEKKSQDLDISKVVSVESVEHHIVQDAIIHNDSEPQDASMNQDFNDNDTYQDHEDLTCSNQVVTVSANPESARNTIKVARITPAEKRAHWAEYSRIRYWIKKWQTCIDKFKNSRSQSVDELKYFKNELKKWKGSMAELVANWAERQKQSNTVESQIQAARKLTQERPTTTAQFTTKTGDKGLFEKEKIIYNRNYKNISNRMVTRRNRIKELVALGKSNTPDHKELTNEVKELISERRKLLEEWTFRRSELGFPIHEPNKFRSKVDSAFVEKLRLQLRSDPEYMNAKSSNLRKRIYRRWYARLKKIHNSTLDCSQAIQIPTKPIATVRVKTAEKYKYKTTSHELIKEVNELNEDSNKKILEEKGARQRIYDQRKAARKRELREIVHSKPVSFRMSQSTRSNVEKPAALTSLSSTPTGIRNVESNRTNNHINLAKSELDNTSDMPTTTEEILNYNSPPTFSQTMNRHQSMIDDHLRLNQSSSIQTQSIRDLELQSQSFSTSTPIINKNSQRHNGIRNLDQLEKEIQTSMPDIKQEYT